MNDPKLGPASLACAPQQNFSSLCVMRERDKAMYKYKFVSVKGVGVVGLVWSFLCPWFTPRWHCPSYVTVSKMSFRSFEDTCTT